MHLRISFTTPLISVLSVSSGFFRERFDMTRPFKILLVDDEPAILGLLGTVLKHDGYDVAFASDGKAALEVLSSRGFDLVVTDLNMGPIDGLAVLQKAKELNPKTNVCVMTGDRDLNLASECLRLGADDFLPKPFHFKELLQRVASLCSKSEFLRQGADPQFRVEELRAL